MATNVLDWLMHLLDELAFTTVEFKDSPNDPLPLTL
jgi:hypothetical protein